MNLCNSNIDSHLWFLHSLLFLPEQAFLLDNPSTVVKLFDCQIIKLSNCFSRLKVLYFRVCSRSSGDRRSEVIIGSDVISWWKSSSVLVLLYEEWGNKFWWTQKTVYWLSMICCTLSAWAVFAFLWRYHTSGSHCDTNDWAVWTKEIKKKPRKTLKTQFTLCFYDLQPENEWVNDNTEVTWGHDICLYS